jgi:DNA polymerase-3 subunit gamma/tau
MSNFVVSARKYRPKTFDEVVGQKHVSDTLKKALQSEKIAHAYLFCGPRGVGKTTCARILAKVMNCDTPIEKHTPCNTCNSCKTFEEYASFNIIELDAASNNSVENIRSLIEQVRIQPQNGKYKTFIIDEVHMLSQAAFNAFLKTLEEPPPNVIFIMATTEKHKILPTILSRCQIYDFKRIQASDIVPQLEFILEKENKTADKEALHIIGQKADGAMRDALSIFDRIASASGDHLSYKDVVNNLNILDYDYYFKMIDHLLIGNLAQVLVEFDSIIHKGFEGDQFVFGLSEHLRNLLMLSFPTTHNLLDVGDTLLKKYQNQVSSISKNVLMTFLNLINQCDVEYATARNKRLHVEITLSKMAYAPKLVEMDAFQEKKKTKIVTENKQEVLAKAAENPSNQDSDEKTEKILTNEAHSLTGLSSAMKPHSSVESNSTIETNSVEQEPPIIQPKAETIQTIHDKESELKEMQETNSEDGKPSSSANDESDIKAPQEDQKEIKTKVDLVNNPNAISKIGSIPSVSVDAFSIMEQQVRKEESERNDNAQPLSVEKAQEVIDKYASTHVSNSIKQVLSILVIEVDEDKLYLNVPSPIAQESVIQQDVMLDLLRTEFGQPDLSIPIPVKPELFPDYSAPKLKTQLTDREKYILLVEKNPLLKDLQKKLDLHPDL